MAGHSYTVLGLGNQVQRQDPGCRRQFLSTKTVPLASEIFIIDLFSVNWKWCLRARRGTKAVSHRLSLISPYDDAILGVCERLFVDLPRTRYELDQFIGLVRPELRGLDLVIGNVAPLGLQNYL